MSLKNLIERKVVTCAPIDPIAEVARTMKREDVGAVVVVEDHRPVGIVTDRDIVIRCVAEGIDSASCAVEEIMTKRVATVAINDGLFNVVESMRKNSIRRVPVIDELGDVVGLLSTGDLLQLMGQEMKDLLSPMAPKRPKIVDRAA